MIKVIEKSKIRTEELSLNLNDKKSANMIVDSFEYLPYIFLKKLNDTNNPPIVGVNIEPSTIIYVKLYNSNFLPSIELYCEDSKGILFNDLYPFDHDTLLCIFIKSNSESVYPIRMDFRVTEYETIKNNDNSNLKYLIKGIINVDDLHYNRFEAKKGTSYNIIKEISTQMNLGFASNVSSSDDEMKWINPSESYITFINEITKYSFISEDSFVWTFIDFYYNINYINIQNELNEFNRNVQCPMTDTQLDETKEEKNSLLYLTNNKSASNSNGYITKYNLINQSYKINLEKNYKVIDTWYDKTENTIYRKTLKNLESDQSKLSSDEGTLKQLIDNGSQLFCENANNEYFIGKIDSKNNVHKNYALAKLSNKFNLKNLEKMKMIVTLDKINFSITRFQNIRVEIYNINDLFSKDADTKMAGENINEKLSGYWIVTGINYIYKRTNGVEQEITLMRRDLSIDYKGQQK